jgi:hypothetical protein
MPEMLLISGGLGYGWRRGDSPPRPILAVPAGLLASTLHLERPGTGSKLRRLSRPWYHPGPLGGLLMVDALRRTFDRVFRSHQHPSIVDEINSFRKLPEGWNSYRAPQISDTAIKAALELVDIVARRGAPAPSAAPTPLGGVALTWSLPTIEAQLLIDDESFDFSVTRHGSPKVVDQGSVAVMYELEKRFIDRYLISRP